MKTKIKALIVKLIKEKKELNGLFEFNGHPFLAGRLLQIKNDLKDLKKLLEEG